MNNITVLMTGAGAPGAPGIIRCYRNNNERDIRIVGADIKTHVPTICQLDAFYTIPRPTSHDFLKAIMKICKHEKVQVIQPLVTKELEFFSNYRDEFEKAGIKVCCSTFECLTIANNKGKLLEHMKRQGMVVPEFRIVNSLDSFRCACEELEYPKKPICFKPTVGNGSRGFRIIDQGKNLGELLFNEKPTSTYISMEQAVSIFEKMIEIPELIVMEYLPGEEYSIDVLANNGKTIVAVPRKRIGMNGGISTNCIVENNTQIISYCKDIILSLKLDGNIGIQVKADDEGIFKILEINPRVQGSIVCCAAAGVNLPYLAIKKVLDEPIGDIKVNWGTEMIRYWNEVYYDVSGLAFTY